MATLMGATLLVLLPGAGPPIVATGPDGIAHACSPDDFNAEGFTSGVTPVQPTSDEAVARPGSVASSATRAFTPAWSSAAPLQVARQEVAVAELDGEIYVIGGIDGGPAFVSWVEIYDPSIDQWRFGPSLPVPLHHTTASAVDGKLYVIGGWSDFFATPLNVVYEHDPNVGGWVARTGMPTARGSPAAAVLDGKIYVGGGWPSARAQDFAVYDPATDQWQTLPDLPTGRNHLGLAAADGRIYAVGGRTSLGAGVDNVADVDVYDPVAGTWSTAPPLSRPRGGLASTGTGPLVFAFGGEGNTESPLGTFEDAEVYDTRTASWADLPDMPTPRHGIGAAVLEGAVHIPGGGPIENFSTTTVHDVLEVSGLLTAPVPGVGVFGLGVLGGAIAWMLARSRAAAFDR